MAETESLDNEVCGANEIATIIVSTDILTKDFKTLDAKSVTFQIWKHRNDADFISTFIEILTKFMDEKRVFDDIEFYLPQLAHMVIHLDVDWENKDLEKFAVLISQASIYVASQLCYILVAAMEDYQPENANGIKNPKANSILFFRCARLLQNVERAVVFGSPELSADEESELASKEATSMYNDILHDNIIRQVKSIVTTSAKASLDKDQIKPMKSDTLLYKRVTRRGIFYTKPWKNRFLSIDQRVLFIYRDEYAPMPLRALPLQGVTIDIPKNAKYPYYFELINTSTNFKFLLRAKDKALFDKWIKLISDEINEVPEDVLAVGKTSVEQQSIETTQTNDTNITSNTDGTMKEMLDSNSNSMRDRETSMTALQHKRFHYFEQQRIFIKTLTDICERLRFLNRDVRKFVLKHHLSELVIPPFTYLPFCRSSDRFKYILRTLPNECHAFNTKARCPALILFEIEAHPNESTDYMTFLSQDIWNYPTDQIIETRQISLPVETECPLPSSAVAEGDEVLEMLPSKLSIPSTGKQAWKEDGTMLRKISSSSRLTPTTKDSFKKIVSSQSSATATTTGTEVSNNLPHELAVDRKVFVDGETFAAKALRIKSKSPYQNVSGWQLDGLIAKSNDDVRQEVFVMQLIKFFENIFLASNVSVWLYTYRILSTSKSTGLIELIPDAISLDGLKKKHGYPGTLRKYFEVTYGYAIAPEDPKSFQNAVYNFVASMAGYSIVTYLLAIKDRHNGNIMLDVHGHVIHIDFGFVFGLAPGKAFSMEKAPFKLNEELSDVMGGRLSPYFKKYKQLCVDALLEARKHADELIALMEIMSFKSNYPAFKYNPNAIRDFKARLFLNKKDEEIPNVVENLINKSYKHTGTDLYDSFQLLTNGIAK